jgi:hypothetical protein
MMNTTLVARVQQFWGRRAEAQAKTVRTTFAPTPAVPDAPATLTLVATQPDPQAEITVLEVKGVLDRRTFEAFIARAADLYAQGCRGLIVDLRGTTRIELAGRFALHNIARLYSGEALLNPEGGWKELHGAATAVTAAMSERVKLLAPPTVAGAIQQDSFCDFLEVYTDLVSAIAAFQRS